MITGPRIEARWLWIGGAVAVPLILYWVLAEQASWRPRTVYRGAPRTAVWALAYAGDGRSLAIAESTANNEQTVVLCDPDTATLRPFPLPGTAYSAALAVSPDGRTLAHGGSDGGMVRLWDVPTGGLHRVLPSTLPLGAAIVLGLAFSSDGKTVASGVDVGVVQVWDAATGCLKHTLFPGRVPPHIDPVWTAVAFSPDRDTVATSDEDGRVSLWNTPTGQLRRTLGGAPGTVESLAFSPAGTLLASASSDGTVCLWSLPGGQLLRHWTKGVTGRDTDYGSAVAVSPDGTLLAATGPQVRVWNIPSGRLQTTLKANGNCLAFSPNSTRLATATWQRLPKNEWWRVLLWRVR